MIEIIGLYVLSGNDQRVDLPSADMDKPEAELLDAFRKAGVVARVQGAGVSLASGERDVEVWADTDELTAHRIVRTLSYRQAWEVTGEI